MSVEIFKIIREEAGETKYGMYKLLGIYSQSTYTKLEQTNKTCDPAYIVRLQDFAHKRLGWTLEKFWKKFKESLKDNK